MSLERLFTWSAETSDAPNATEFDVYAIATSPVYTGSKSYNLIGTSYGIRGTTTADQLSGHYFVMQRVTRFITNHYPVIVGLHAADIMDTPTHFVRINTATNKLEMYVDEVLVDSKDMFELDLGCVSRWFSCGFTIKAHASTGFFSFYLDGEKVLSYTGAVLSWVGVSIASRASILVSNWASAYVDDVYVDSAIGEADTPPIQRRFLTAVPSAAGADTTWTPSTGSNYQNVDDTPLDNESTYNSATSSGLKDTFNFPDITSPNGNQSLHTIWLGVYARKSEGSSTEIKLHAYDGSTYESSTAFSLLTEYAYYMTEFALQNDSTSWDVTDFNAYQFGYESAGSF